MIYDTFINFGNFELNKVIIVDHTSSYIGGRLVRVANPENPDENLTIIFDKIGVDIENLRRTRKLINIKGSIWKNPKTHKTLYILEDSNGVELV